MEIYKGKTTKRSLDAKAQTDIVFHKDFIDYIDKIHLYHWLDNHEIWHSPMVECRAISHLLVYIITY